MARQCSSLYCYEVIGLLNMVDMITRIWCRVCLSNSVNCLCISLATMYVLGCLYFRNLVCLWLFKACADFLDTCFILLILFVLLCCHITDFRYYCQVRDVSTFYTSFMLILVTCCYFERINTGIKFKTGLHQVQTQVIYLNYLYTLQTKNKNSIFFFNFVWNLTLSLCSKPYIN